MPLLRRRQNGSFECFDAMKKGQLEIGAATPERGVEDERKVSFELAAMASTSKLRSRISLLLKYLIISFLTNHYRQKSSVPTFQMLHFHITMIKRLRVKNVDLRRGGVEERAEYFDVMR